MLRTIMFAPETGQWWETSPDQLATTGNLRQPIRFMATQSCVIAARVDWDLSTVWLMDAWTRFASPKHAGRNVIGNITRDDICLSGLLLTEGDPIIIGWEPDWHGRKPSRAFFKWCMAALGASKEHADAKRFRQG